MRVNRGKTVLSKIVERTGPKSKNNGFSDKKKNPANPLVYWIFRWRRRGDSTPRYREVQLISSQSRYDHFDTSPYMSIRSIFTPKTVKIVLERTDGKNSTYSIFESSTKPDKSRVFAVQN